MKNTYLTVRDLADITSLIFNLSSTLNANGERWQILVEQYTAVMHCDLDGETAKSLGILQQSMVDYLTVTLAELNARLSSIKVYTLPRDPNETPISIFDMVARTTSVCSERADAPYLHDPGHPDKSNS